MGTMKDTTNSNSSSTAPSSAGQDPRAAIRRLARSLALASHSGSPDVLKEPRIQLAQLTAGLDPDAVDPESADFRFGAAQALGRVLNGLAEQAMSHSTVEMLFKKQRARVLTSIAAESGSPQKELSERLGIRESNLSRYVQELAGAGLIEPAATAASNKKGKAWELSPWGVKTFFTIVSGPVAANVPDDELAAGLSGARQRHSVIALDVAQEGARSAQPMTISKNEVYRRLEEALGRRTDRPLHLTTLFAGDLRDHERPWKLHDLVFHQGVVRRPVEWVFFADKRTEGWLPGLLSAAEGNAQLSIWTIGQTEEVSPTVQVLDDEGLVYPLPPQDEGYVQSRAASLMAWTSFRDQGELKLMAGSVA
jgi:MarR family